MSITITEVRNARSMNETNTVIDVEINHPEYGWVPYLLTDYDVDTTVDNDAVMALIGTDFEAYVPPTQAELDTEAAAQVRYERDNRLVTEVDPIVSNALRWADLTAEQQAAWTQYRSDLLAVPQQDGFPNTITWPTKPS
jgi:hypothetical protein